MLKIGTLGQHAVDLKSIQLAFRSIYLGHLAQALG
jgi:hypothetical protein